MKIEEQKKLIKETLDKVERGELPLFIKDLKEKTFLRVMFGLMSKETGDVLLETCDEYLRSYEVQRYMEKAIEKKLEAQQAKAYHKPVVDISKLKPDEVSE